MLTIYVNVDVTMLQQSMYQFTSSYCSGKYRNICSTNIVTKIKSVILLNILHIVTILSFSNDKKYIFCRFVFCCYVGIFYVSQINQQQHRPCQSEGLRIERKRLILKCCVTNCLSTSI